jgi:hypothetical protein
MGEVGCSCRERMRIRMKPLDVLDMWMFIGGLFKGF